MAGAIGNLLRRTCSHAALVLAVALAARLFAADQNDAKPTEGSRSNAEAVDSKSTAKLTPTVEASRQGRTLELDYELLDAGGRDISSRDYGDRPEFVIYKNGRQIGSGTFEYG